MSTSKPCQQGLHKNCFSLSCNCTECHAGVLVDEPLRTSLFKKKSGPKYKGTGVSHKELDFVRGLDVNKLAPTKKKRRKL